AAKKTTNVRDIYDKLDKAKELSEDKIQLAMQTYEMVDKHIRRLDSELSRLESELKEKQVPFTADDGKKRSKGRDKRQSFNPKNVIKDENEKSRRKGKGSSAAAGDNVNTVALLSGEPSSILGTEMLDMPV